MADTKNRLIRCFAAIFPHLKGSEITQAAPDSTVGWDSLATVNLFALVQAEFGVNLDSLDDDESISFYSMLSRLEASRGTLDKGQFDEYRV